MEHQFDTLAKSLAGSISRREALSRVGGGIAGLLLASLGAGRAWSAPATNSGCEDFCRTNCGISPGGGNAFGKCVSSCEHCVKATGSLPCGCPASPGGDVVCCPVGATCISGSCVCPGDTVVCSGVCTSLTTIQNCGRCGNVCPSTFNGAPLIDCRPNCGICKPAGCAYDFGPNLVICVCAA